MDNLKSATIKILRWSEGFFKTDMVYMAKGGFWLGVGQVMSAVIALGSSLFFANLVSKDIYGNYKYIIAATGILGAFSLTGMGSVVSQGVAQGYEGILKNAVKTTLKWSLIITGVAFLTAIYYFSKSNTTLGFAMIIAGVSLPLSQSFTLYGNYLSGKKDFRRITLYSVASQFLTTASLVATAVLTKNILAMVCVYFALTTITTVWAYRHTLKIFHINDSHDHTLIAYGKHLSLIGLFGTIANQFDKILVFHYLGALNLAIYAFSQAIPDQIRGVFKSVFTMAVPKYAVLSETDMRHSMIKKFFQLTSITIIVALAYIVSAPFIFKLLFPKYIDSVFYSQIYILGLITIPGIGFFSNYFQLKKATKLLYKLNIIGNTSTLLITFVLIYKYGILGAVLANGLSWLIMLIVHGYYFATDKSYATE